MSDIQFINEEKIVEKTVGEEEILAAQRILALKIIEQEGSCVGIDCPCNSITIDTGVEVECECPLLYDQWDCFKSVDWEDDTLKVPFAKQWLEDHPEEVTEEEILAAQRILALKIIEQEGSCDGIGCKMNMLSDKGVEVRCKCPLRAGQWDCNYGVGKETVNLAKKWLEDHPE